MSDVFISYARSTEREARVIAERLRALGFGVWRDDEIPAHRSFAEVIEERLSAAKAVVVVWSADAIASEWVCSEANRARTQRKLVQLRVDAARLPMPFDQIQCVDLVGWDGDSGAPGWRKVVSSVGELVGSPSLRDHLPDPPRSPKGRVSICVLPFANISGDPEQEYFSDGISEDIITDLSKVSALSVTARNTAFGFKGKSPNVKEVAQQLGVSHVLEGSVRKAGNRVRITAQLIDGAAGDHVWAERWDRDLDDIFALQDEISQAIVAALKLKLLPEEKLSIEKRGTDSADAYDLYLMARRLYWTGDYVAPRDEQVIRLCEAATKIDPGYAQAWALMARAQASLRTRGRRDVDPSTAIDRALKLDPDLSEPHAIRAALLFSGEHYEDAWGEYETALRLDPQSFESNRGAGRLQWAMGHYRRAAAILEKAMTLDELEFDCPMKLFSCYAALGDVENTRRVAAVAADRAEAAVARDPSNAYAMGVAAYAFAALGQEEKAREHAGRGLTLGQENVALLYNLVCAFSRYLNEPDTAIALLTTLAQRMPKHLFLEMKTDPGFEPLRGDQRFLALVDALQARFAVSEDSVAD